MTETTIAGRVDDDVPFFPTARTCPFSAPPAHTAFREAGGLHQVALWDGSRHWLVTRHEDIRAVLGSPAFTADLRDEGYPLVHPNQRETEGGTFLRLDDPEHNRLRRILAQEFSVRRTRSMRPRLLAVADQLIDDMLATAGGPVDFVKAFALPLPSHAMCLVLGVPYEAHALFQQHAAAESNLDNSHADRERHYLDALAYYDELIEYKSRHPADDMISRLLAEHTGPHAFPREDLPRLVAVLVGAGHETTANALGLGTLALLVNPDQRLKLRAHPELATSTAEEMLRYWSVLSTDPRRLAVEDVEIGGTLVRKGEGVVVSLVAGNRDPRVFGGDADDIDITRGVLGHVAFGFGTHQCLGQNLARVELEIAWPRLFERIPDLRLAVPEDQLVFKRNSIIFGVESLPVAWGPPR
ncbi:cytochrome P450 [Streptomyces scopuliridis]|uniref:cytochrome P450 n=1 Tax=Streptomyces scopuliridis TaxID=452529 RepID=UPI003433CF35